MYPYLSRLGVTPALQDFLRPFCSITEDGGLCFSYGDAAEIFGMAYHYVPTNGWWQAARCPPAAASHLLIASSAMEAIAFLQLQPRMAAAGMLRIIAAGTRPEPSAFLRLAELVKRRRISVLYGSDLPGRIITLRLAAALRGFPLSAGLRQGRVVAAFRGIIYDMDPGQISLPAFEKLCGNRFYIHTPQPSGAATFLEQLRFH